MIRAAGCIVYRKSRGFLLLKKKDLWEFPKGKVDPADVDIRATALRETQEETSLTDITVIEGFHAEEMYKLAGEDKHVDYYLALTHENPKISSEHLGYGWFSAEEALKYLAFEGKRHALSTAVVFLQEKGVY